MKDRNKLIFYIVLGLIAIVSIILGLILFTGKKEEVKKDNRTIEEIIKDNYDFTDSDAISLIKKVFNSDNYKFEAIATKDGLYEVTVTNTVTNSKFIYYVDPATKTYRLDENSK